MDQMGMTARDLIPFIGSRAKVSEVLSGKRPITMAMARALHQHLRIPADILLRNPGATLPHDRPDIDWTRFPLKALAKAGWIPDLPRLKDHAEELVRGLIDGAGGPEFALAPLYRKNDDRRVNAKTDEYALNAWCWRVIAEATGRHFSAEYQSGTVTPEFPGPWLSSAHLRRVPGRPAISWPSTASALNSCPISPEPTWTGRRSGFPMAGLWSR